ncbi:hypothetical protein G6F46_014870 [Rhizopus delemar]|nr:hypothetical protein G6F46_014870 [Rhizopus delemar]
MGNIPARQHDGAAVLALQAGNGPQQGRLAATGRPQQRDELALFNRQAQVGNDAQVAIVLGDVVQPQK